MASKKGEGRTEGPAGSARALAAAALLVLLLSFFFFAPASSSEAFPRVAIIPPSPFYGMKLVLEHIALAFTFGDGARAGLAIDHADARLAEVAQLFRDNRTEGTAPVQAEYAFIMESYSSMRKPASAEERFARHVAALDALSATIRGSDWAPERQKLFFGIIVSNMRGTASIAGAVPPTGAALTSPDRLVAERAIGDAEGALYVFSRLPGSSEDACKANETLESAKRLLEDRQYIAARAVSSELLAYLSSRLSNGSQG